MLGTFDNYKIIPQAHKFKWLSVHAMFSRGRMFTNLRGIEEFDEA